MLQSALTARIARLFGALLLCVLCASAYHLTVTTAHADTTNNTAMSAATEANLTRIVRELAPKSEAIHFAPSPIDGFYFVGIDNQWQMISTDGRYFIPGDVWDMAAREKITVGLQREGNLTILESIPKDEWITYAAADQKSEIWAFTDIDCHYCRKLHAEMDELNRLGVTVHYLAFPRSGKRAASFGKSEQVWCAEDRHTAMDAAKQGAATHNIPQVAACDVDILKHYEVGQRLQVRGTPTLVKRNGDILPGYLPAKDILRWSLM